MDVPLPDDELAYISDGLGATLETMLVYNLIRTHAYIAPQVESSLREQRLTAAQFNTLLLLAQAEPEGLSMRAIGEGLVVTKSNVTGLIDRLERDGLVTRVADSGDRRTRRVRISSAGQAQVARCVPEHQRLLATLSECLSPGERRDCVRLLSKLRRSLREIWRREQA